MRPGHPLRFCAHSERSFFKLLTIYADAKNIACHLLRGFEVWSVLHLSSPTTQNDRMRTLLVLFTRGAPSRRNPGIPMVVVLYYSWQATFVVPSCIDHVQIRSLRLERCKCQVPRARFDSSVLAMIEWSPNRQHRNWLAQICKPSNPSVSDSITAREVAGLNSHVCVFDVALGFFPDSIRVSLALAGRNDTAMCFHHVHDEY